jgi:HSP20 family protein
MGIEDEFEDMRKTINRILKDAFDGKLGVFREPFVYGFTMRSREARNDGTFQAVEGSEMSARDPVTDVLLTPTAVHVTAEMPGAREDGVRVRMEPRRLVLEGDGDKRYFTTVNLPDDLDPGSVECTFHNGVLDVTLKRGKTVPQT